MERVFGTHNSFHKEAKFKITKSMANNMPLLEEQFKMGARQIELDLWWDDRKKKLMVYHLPFIDNNSNVATFKEALEIIYSYNDYQDHEGLYVLIEPKGFYSPFKNIMPELFLEMIESEIFHEIFENEIVIPRDVLTTKSRADNRRNFLLRAKNRVSFILLDKFWARYIQRIKINKGIRTPLFISNDKRDEKCIFYNQNNPYKKRDYINKLVYDGFIVRTRADVDGIKCKEIAEEAIISNAQIISTDFPQDFLNKTEKEIRETINTYSYINDISYVEW